MGNVMVTRRIEAAVERVFEAFTDFEHLAERLSGVIECEVLTDGPIGVGTRFREKRMMFKKEAVEVMEITAFEAGKSYTISANSCGCEMHFDHSFREENGGTVFEMAMRTKALTFGAKLMSPMMFLMKGTMVKCINKDMDEMIAAIEA